MPLSLVLRRFSALILGWGLVGQVAAQSPHPLPATLSAGQPSTVAEPVAKPGMPVPPPAAGGSSR